MKRTDVAIFSVVVVSALAAAVWSATLPPPPQIECDCPCAEMINNHAMTGDSIEYMAEEHQKCVEYWTAKAKEAAP